MKYLILLGCISPFFIFGQKHDYIWISGDSNTPNTTAHGGIVIDFNQTPVKPYYKYRDLNMFICNASICDSFGRLLAYTNGCHIAGANDSILENGNMINPGTAWQVSCIQNADGYASGIQSAVFLPLPENDSIYYLFHKPIKLILTPLSGYPEGLLYSVVNMKENNGIGKVTSKNVEVIKDTL
ncbi:MAG: hypothetical protein JNK89_02645, partial [Saprospiraceae bacterium]|nr:hypothetical protein [Saprospiraceae bacterium]